MSDPSPLTSRSFGTWLDSALPQNRGQSFHDDLQCFGIPFGGLGFLSEIILLYTTHCLLAGVDALPWSPLKPTRFQFFRPIEKGWGNLLVSIITILAIVPLALLTMIRCRANWELILVCIFRLGIALAVATFALYSCANAESEEEQQGDADESNLLEPETRPKKGNRFLHSACRMSTSLIWVLGPIAAILTAFGCLFDCIAVTSITVKAVHSGELKMTTGRRWALALTTPLRVMAFYSWIAGLLYVFLRKKEGKYMLVGGIWALLVYSDFSIADAAHKMDGVPSSSAAVVYWIYFLVKRLPMLIS